MSLPETKTSWNQPVILTNETKAATRVAVPKGMSWEQIGIDGSLEGGKRPYPGLLFFRDLSGNLGSIDQELSDFFPVTFRVSATKYAYGFVYRVRTGTACKYFLEYRVGTSLTWYGPVDLRGQLNDGDKQMHVTVWGRYVYVFVSGSQPFVFYLIEDPVGTYTLTINADTGPGTSPEFFNQALHYTSSVEQCATVMDDTSFLTGVTSPGRARMLGFVFWPAATVNGTTDQNYDVGDTAGTPTLHQAINGPSDVPVTPVCAQEDPTFSIWSLYAQITSNGTQDDSPIPLTAYQYSLVTGVPDKYFSYSYAYVLYDSRTGRKSQASSRFISNPGRMSPAFAPTRYDMVNSWEGDRLFNPALDIVYDNSKYDTILMYRSPAYLLASPEAPPPSPDNFLLKLDSIRTLADYDISTTSTLPAGFSRSLIFYHLSNEALLTQEDLEEDTFLADMPTAGSSIFYEKTMLLGKLGELDPDIGGLGVFYWSNLLQTSVETFKASDRYLMTLPDEEVECFQRLGTNVLALTKQSAYLVRRETIFLKAFPLAEGFGVTGHRAACTVGSNVYYLTGQGLKVMDSDGALSDVDALNHLIQNEWKDSLESVEMSFDPTAKCINILNPTLDHLVVLWTQTGQVTELLDCPMAHVGTGNIPHTDEAGSPLERRSVFVQPVDVAGDFSDWKWRVYTHDYARQKPYLQTLHPTGTMLATTTNTFTSGVNFTVTGIGWGTRLEGCKIYALDGEYAGISVTIKTRLSNTVVELGDDAANFYGIPIGTRIGLSPIYFRWVGHGLGLEMENEVPIGSPQNFFFVRQAEALACSFVDVDPGGVVTGLSNKDARYRGLLYRGTETTPKSAEFPVNADGTKYESIRNGASEVYAPLSPEKDTDALETGRYGYSAPTLFPGVEVFVPGLDFRLLAVSVEGTMKDKNT